MFSTIFEFVVILVAACSSSSYFAFSDASSPNESHITQFYSCCCCYYYCYVHSAHSASQVYFDWVVYLLPTIQPTKNHYEHHIQTHAHTLELKHTYESICTNFPSNVYVNYLHARKNGIFRTSAENGPKVRILKWVILRYCIGFSSWLPRIKVWLHQHTIYECESQRLKETKPRLRKKVILTFLNLFIFYLPLSHNINYAWRIKWKKK